MPCGLCVVTTGTVEVVVAGALAVVVGAWVVVAGGTAFAELLPLA